MCNWVIQHFSATLEESLNTAVHVDKLSSNQTQLGAKVIQKYDVACGAIDLTVKSSSLGSHDEQTKCQVSNCHFLCAIHL